MKLTVISDSHDNIPNIDKMLDFVKKENINVMLHCGDVCAPSVMKYLAENFTCEIYLVYGNVDGDIDKMKEIAKDLKNLHLLGEVGEPQIFGLKFPPKADQSLAGRIGMVHYPAVAKKMAVSGNYEVVFYGHNHKAWEEKVGDCQLINPGTLAGLFALATFAVYDTETKKAELKILHKLQ